jgi:hypothetical protein
MRISNILGRFLSPKKSPLLHLRFESKNGFHQTAILKVKNKFYGCKMIREHQMAAD